MWVLFFGVDEIRSRWRRVELLWRLKSSSSAIVFVEPHRIRAYPYYCIKLLYIGSLPFWSALLKLMQSQAITNHCFALSIISRLAWLGFALFLSFQKSYLFHVGIVHKYGWHQPFDFGSINNARRSTSRQTGTPVSSHERFHSIQEAGPSPSLTTFTNLLQSCVFNWLSSHRLLASLPRPLLLEGLLLSGWVWRCS